MWKYIFLSIETVEKRRMNGGGGWMTWQVKYLKKCEKALTSIRFFLSLSIVHLNWYIKIVKWAVKENIFSPPCLETLWYLFSVRWTFSWTDKERKSVLKTHKFLSISTIFAWFVSMLYMQHIWRKVGGRLNKQEMKIYWTAFY